MMHHIKFILSVVLISIITSCTQNPEKSNQYDYENDYTGAVTTSLVWPEESFNTDNIVARAASIDCNTMGISNIVLRYYTEERELLNEGRFECSLGKGTVDGILAGDHRTLIASVYNTENQEIFRGERVGITITGGIISNIGETQMEKITANTAPTAMIHSPKAGTFLEGALISFIGSALDPEDGIIADNSLVWYSNIDGQLDKGESFSKSDLTIGRHHIILTVTNTADVMNSASVYIDISDEIPSTAPVYPPEIDSFEIDDAYSTATEIQTDGTVQFHEIEPNNNDWLQFSATAGSIYEITLDNIIKTDGLYAFIYKDAGPNTQPVYQNQSIISTKNSDTSLLAFKAPTSGTYYIKLTTYYRENSSSTYIDTSTTHSGSCFISVYESISISNEDTYINDDSFSTATEIETDGTVQFHEIEPNDNDWLQFSATAGSICDITLKRVIKTNGFYAYIYKNAGPNATPAYQNQSISISKDAYSGSLQFTAPTSGTYFIKLTTYYRENLSSTYIETAAIESGSCIISVDMVQLASNVDFFVDDNSYATATEIEPNGESQFHEIEPNDNDWLRFEATAGTEYLISLSEVLKTNGLYVYIYRDAGANNTPAYQNQSINVTTVSDSGSLPFTAPTSGIYYIKLTTYYRENLSSTYIENTAMDSGSCRISIETSSSSSNEDIYENDDSYSSATEIETNGSAQFHEIEPNNNDWLQFDATAGNTYDITVSNVLKTGGFYVYIYRDAGANNTPAYQNQSISVTGASDSGALQLTAPTSGIYYIKLTTYYRENSSSTYIDNSATDSGSCLIRVREE